MPCRGRPHKGCGAVRPAADGYTGPPAVGRRFSVVVDRVARPVVGRGATERPRVVGRPGSREWRGLRVHPQVVGTTAAPAGASWRAQAGRERRARSAVSPRASQGIRDRSPEVPRRPRRRRSPAPPCGGAWSSGRRRRDSAGHGSAAAERGWRGEPAGCQAPERCEVNCLQAVRRREAGARSRVERDPRHPRRCLGAPPLAEIGVRVAPVGNFVPGVEEPAT